MNQKLKKALIISGYVLLSIPTVYIYFYLFHLRDIFKAFLLAKTSSEVLAFFITVATLIAAFFIAHAINRLYSNFAEKITSNYQSFKNENSDDNIFSEVYNDPTIGLKDKVLFFHIYLMYCIQLPFLYYVPKISYVLDAIRYNPFVSIFVDFALVVVNTMLLIPVAILELIKYPLIKLFSPFGLSVKQLSFLFNVSDVGTGGQSVHTSSFEHTVIKCAKELKEKHGTPSSELEKEFRDYISSLTDQQKQMIAPYLRLDGYEMGPWVSWRDSKTGLTLTQAINLVLTAARERNTDIELLKSILLVRFEESNRQCGPGMLNRIIYALSGLEAENNFAAQLEPQPISELAGDITKRFFQKYIDKHYHKIKILKDNFNDLYSPNSGVDLNNISNEVKNDICSMRKDIKEFVFKELYVKFYDDYGEHIQRGPIKQKLRELITDKVVDSIIYAVIDDVEIPREPSTYFEKVQALFGCARFSAA